jgi:hypothetical protein
VSAGYVNEAGFRGPEIPLPKMLHFISTALEKNPVNWYISFRMLRK